MSLVGNVYIQSTDPGNVGFGYGWANSSTGLFQTRNTANTAWVPQGNWNSSYGGCLPLSGGVMTGAITGAHGLVAASSPAFSSQPTYSDVNLATINDVNNAVTALTTALNNNIKSAVSSITGNFNIGANIAWGSGTVADGGTVPLPSFGGASPRQALLSEVVAVVVSAGKCSYGAGSEATTWQTQWTVNTGTLAVSAGNKISGGGGGSNHSSTDGVANYLIICVRNGA